MTWLLVFCSLSSLLFDDTDQMDGASGAESQPDKVINIKHTVLFFFFHIHFLGFVCLSEMGVYDRP